jgi:error-prone DNA polymerase
VPVENAAMPGRTVIQWDKDDIEALGLLKVDILALGMLSALRRSFALIRAAHGVESTCSRSRRGPGTYAMLSAPTAWACSRSSRARRWRCCRASDHALSTTW